MLIMILKMTAVTALYVAITALLWRQTRNRKLRVPAKILVGLVYGGLSVLSTHFGVDYGEMVVNIRDMGPLAAGLFFDPLSGILAGLIGGIERWIAGTYWDVGSYTRIACSISTCLAGFLSALLRTRLLKNKMPSATYCFLLGSVMEVFHMYAVFITHRDDMMMAFHVVRTCAVWMILFTGISLAASSIVLQKIAGEWHNPFRRVKQSEVPLSRRFQTWLMVFTVGMLLLNTVFAFFVQTRSNMQNARDSLTEAAQDIKKSYESGETHINYHIGMNGSFDLISEKRLIFNGTHAIRMLTEDEMAPLLEEHADKFFDTNLFNAEAMTSVEKLRDGTCLLLRLPYEEIYLNRNIQLYETVLAYILVFTVIYVLISQLIQQIVVRNLSMINESLGKITNGDLNEVVNVRTASEFTSLSDDINQTVDTLKGYIAAAEKRIEEELQFAWQIQDSSLPKNFTFARKDFDIYATMDPAKEIGGDFYDFFFVGPGKLALVIADVSGKGIPAALFMMRAKTAIRNLAESGKEPAEILKRANSELCEGNDADMFVTVWLGLMNLDTGVMQCANAGHEYPVLMRTGGEYELIKDKHGLALAAMDGVSYRSYELQLHPGDKLFVYTDGVPEAINTDVEQYGTDRLLTVLNARKDEAPKDLLPEVRQDISAFAAGTDQFDDITMLGFVYTGNASTVVPDEVVDF